MLDRLEILFAVAAGITLLVVLVRVWNARQLRPEHERVLASWPPTLRVEIRGLATDDQLPQCQDRAARFPRSVPARRCDPS